ncbi:MAG TPA: phage baseplate assembly protein V [Kofleriaceae bacterium]|nr:phage baseplate assembly protein V [Kofleriaceae bacterium]
MRAGGPRIESLDNLQFGLHYGIVCQNKDPDNLDRIKIRLPELDGGDVDQTHWAQLLTPMEGKKFGWYTLPDVDDVVVVMFIGGDMSQPVIVGGVWSTPDNSPEPNQDGANNFRGYRSRSGHRLILDDTNKTKVVIADKTTKNMFGIGEFDQAGAGPNVCAPYKPPMSGTSGVSFSTMEGKMEITCKNGKLSIEAQQNIKMNAKTTIDMKAGGDLTMEASSAAKLTSGSPSNLDAPTIEIA